MPRGPRTLPKKQAKQERSRATVEAILTAASRILVKEGYDRTSTTAIAERAGVSIGSLYQYFPGKEAIVAELIDRHVQKMFSLVQGELVVVAELPLREAVPRLVGLFFSAYAVDEKLRRVFIEQVPRVGRLDRMRVLEEGLLAMVCGALQHHRVRCRDLELASLVVVRTVAALTYTSRVDPRGILPQVMIEEISQLVLRYLL